MNKQIIGYKLLKIAAVIVQKLFGGELEREGYRRETDKLKRAGKKQSLSKEF